MPQVYSSLERFLAAKAFFYWWKSGAGRKKQKSMILGTTLQKCWREVRTSEWLFISYYQWLNMNSPFPYDPLLADDLLVHDFHSVSSHWHEKRKLSVRSKGNWNHILRGWGAHLQTFSPTCTCALCFLKTPRSVPFPTSFERHWIVSTAAVLEKHWSDAFWPFPPFCLLKGDHDFSVLISLFYVMQRSINSILVNFLCCSNMLTTITNRSCDPQVTHRMDFFSLSFGVQGDRVSFPLFPTLLLCICSEPRIISKMISCLWFCTFCSLWKIPGHFWGLTAIWEKCFQTPPESTTLCLWYSF